MSTCQHCSRTTQLHLCTPCTKNLADLLAELPWLLHQLDVTLCRQDRLNTGANPTHNLDANPVNVGAMELMRKACGVLRRIALDAAEIHATERIPALVNASPSQVALWLKHNLRAIQNHPNAGQHYTAIKDLVGDTQPGPIHHAINRPDTHFAGPCPTIRGHNRDGEPIHCNTTLWAHDGEQFTRCPHCQCDIDIHTNMRRAAALNDLLPEETILEALEYHGTPTTRATLIGWITTKKLLPRAYLTRKGRRPRKQRSTDPELYSFREALHLQQKQTTCV